MIDDRDKRVVLAYAENNMNLTATAKVVYMGVSTIRYRLHIVRQQTGLNPQRFYDLVNLVEMCKGDNE